ncbi:MAG: hypothetical protein JSR58_03895 [Verrucomicrobia bacterium]|nr:hypothetical protein [Verrucomicrobiota bacterium]
MTQGKDLRRRMIQDLQSSTKPQLIYRLRLSDLRALFYRNLSISLPGPLEVRVMDLNLENRRFVQNILEEQGQVSFDSVISLLNQPLHSLQQSISTISFGEVKKYDSAAHAITIDFPQGMCLSTRFNDMSMAFSDLKRRVSTRAFHIAPFQNLYVFDWSNELNAFFHHRISHSLPNPHFDLLPLVLDFFTRHLLKLNLHGNVWVSYEPWFNRILLCSEAFISVSKLPIESE